MTREISNYDDIIDSRDVIERIELLTEARNDSDLTGELALLRTLAEQGEGIEDWQYGATLIRDSYFVEYAKQFAEDVGAIDESVRWPATHIDWDAAADDLRGDYTELEFNGVTYWVR